MLAVSAANTGDAVRIAALYAEALPPGWPVGEIAACFGDANRAVLRCNEGERLTGFVILQFAADEAEILALAVAKDKQRQGHASHLMKAALNFCLNRFVSCLYLEVAESNSPARALYQQFGFSIVARRENYYTAARSVPETAFIMKLSIERLCISG